MTRQSETNIDRIVTENMSRMVQMKRRLNNQRRIRKMVWAHKIHFFISRIHPLPCRYAFLFLITALFRSYCVSMPIIPNVMDPRERLQSGPVLLQDHRLRTHFDIVWNCVSTLFICTWVAIHPNIPQRGESHIRSFTRRLRLTLWTLVVPELILIWAYRQWSAAR